jgi:hypothetical protein
MKMSASRVIIYNHVLRRFEVLDSRNEFVYGFPKLYAIVSVDAVLIDFGDSTIISRAFDDTFKYYTCAFSTKPLSGAGLS